MSTEQISEAFLRIAGLAEALGISNLKEYPGTWDHQVDPVWKIFVNGHPEEVNKIPPFHAVIERNGMPFGILNPYGGQVIGGSETEDEIITALENATKAAEVSP